MSKDRINLYSQEFRPVKTLLSLKHISISLLIALVLLIGTLSYSGWRHHITSTEARAIDNVLYQKQTELATQEALLAAHKPASALLHQVKQLQQSLTIKDALLNELLSRDKESKQGYSSLLTALAQTDKGSLWLTHIYANGNKVNLRGQSLSSDAVPAWLIQFKQFPALADKQFKAMQIWRDEDQALLFNLSSLDPQEKENNEP